MLFSSVIPFGAQVEKDVKETDQSHLWNLEQRGTGSCLNLPECFIGSRTELLGFIYDTLRDRLTTYFAKLLSQGEKKILLKTVAIAIPV